MSPCRASALSNTLITPAVYIVHRLMPGTGRGAALVAFAALRSITRKPQHHHFHTTSRRCWVHLTSSLQSLCVAGPSVTSSPGYCHLAHVSRSHKICLSTSRRPTLRSNLSARSSIGDDLCEPSALCEIDWQTYHPTPFTPTRGDKSHELPPLSRLYLPIYPSQQKHILSSNDIQHEHGRETTHRAAESHA